MEASRDLEGYQGPGAEAPQVVRAPGLQATDGLEMNRRHGLDAFEDRTPARIGWQSIEGVVSTHRPRQVQAVEAAPDEVTVQEEEGLALTRSETTNGQSQQSPVGRTQQSREVLDRDGRPECRLWDGQTARLRDSVEHEASGAGRSAEFGKGTRDSHRRLA